MTLFNGDCNHGSIYVIFIHGVCAHESDYVRDFVRLDLTDQNGNLVHIFVELVLQFIFSSGRNFYVYDVNRHIVLKHASLKFLGLKSDLKICSKMPWKILRYLLGTCNPYPYPVRKSSDKF